MKFATLLTSALIIIAVLIPGSNLPDVGIGGFDKLVHIAMFALWAVAARYDLYHKPFRWWMVLSTGLLFSGVTEVLQLLVEGRTFDIYDMIADAAGLIAGLLIGGPVVKWIRSRS